MTPARAELQPLAAQLDDILACIHCGFCLPACPTYELLGDENDSPRGRIYLMRAVAEGRLDAADPSFALHMDCCLGCRACEPVCPSGVRYGLLLERAREARAAAGGMMDRAARFALNLLFARRRLQNFFWAVLRLIRASRLPLLLARAGRSREVPGRFRFAMAMLAATAPRSARALSASGGARGRGRAAGPPDEAAGTVALLEGCVMSGLFRHVNRATERVVKAHGARAISLPAGLCCGALNAHAGELERARSLARRLIAQFEASGAELLLTNSAGCGAALKDYGEWLREDAAYAKRARRLASAARDLSEWLVGRPGPRYASRKARVACDAPCHQLHAQRIAEAPVELLARISGLEIVPLPRAERCCGGAGIYGLTRRRLSEDLLRQKLEEVEAAGAQWLATGNPGCLMQIGAGAIIRGRRIHVVHPVELLDGALGSPDPPPGATRNGENRHDAP